MNSGNAMTDGERIAWKFTFMVKAWIANNQDADIYSVLLTPRDARIHVGHEWAVRNGFSISECSRVSESETSIHYEWTAHGVTIATCIGKEGQ